jgi:hypothetical protein
MSRLRRIMSVRVIAILSCILAFGAYLAFSPTPSYADYLPDESGPVQCTYAGQKYDVGACRGGQRCGVVGGEPTWVDDPSCPR